MQLLFAASLSNFSALTSTPFSSASSGTQLYPKFSLNSKRAGTSGKLLGESTLPFHCISHKFLLVDLRAFPEHYRGDPTITWKRVQ